MEIELEIYPTIEEDQWNKLKELAETNAKHWDDPFFMDVYAHADLKELRQVVAPFLENEKINNIILLATGGSIQTMLTLQNFSKKKVYAITSSRPYELNRVLHETSPEDSVVLPISRGGKTLDVNSTIHLFQEYPMIALSSRGPMNDVVKELGAPIVEVPDLSGRFAASICSVGLVPALLAEIEIEKFLTGLDKGYSLFKDLTNQSENYAFQYAIYLYERYQEGYTNIFSMPYSSWLEGAAGLFVQELSESSGKEGKGLLGTTQEAPLCQHSVLELLLGGKKNHTSPLLWTTTNEPNDISLESNEERLQGQSGLSVINYQADATFEALLSQGVPTANIKLKVSEEAFGQLVAWIQAAVYYFCLLLDVNWASNPLVNTGKKICNQALDQRLTAEERKNKRIQSAKNF